MNNIERFIYFLDRPMWINILFNSSYTYQGAFKSPSQNYLAAKWSTEEWTTRGITFNLKR